MPNTSTVVSAYPSHTDAESAIKELQDAGVDLKKLSIVGNGFLTEEHVVGYYNIGDRMKHWGKLGAFWGGLWGLLLGSAFFLTPGIGAILVAGPLVQVIVSVLEGAVTLGGMSAFGAGLYSIGIPENSILQYETALKTDQFLLVVHGSEREVALAKEILQTTASTHVGHYPAAETANAVI